MAVARRTGSVWNKLKAQVLKEEDHCWICNKPVTKTIKWPDPMSPSVDHVIPINQGGSQTTRSNLRLAHLSCNSSRGDGTRKRLPTSRQWLR